MRMVLIKLHKLCRTKQDYPACNASIFSNPAESSVLCQCQKVGELPFGQRDGYARK